MVYIWHSEAIIFAYKTGCIDLLLNSAADVSHQMFSSTYRILISARIKTENPNILKKVSNVGIYKKEPTDEQNKVIDDFVNKEILDPELTMIYALFPQDKEHRLIVDNKTRCNKLSPYQITIWKLLNALFNSGKLSTQEVKNIISIVKQKSKSRTPDLCYIIDPDFRKLYNL